MERFISHPDHNGNAYLPWKSLFANTKFIDVLDSRYPLREEDNKQITIIIKAGAPVSSSVFICGKCVKNETSVILWKERVLTAPIAPQTAQ